MKLKLKMIIASSTIIGGLVFGGFQFVQADAEPTKTVQPKIKTKEETMKLIESHIEKKDVTAEGLDVTKAISYFSNQFNGEDTAGIQRITSVGFGEEYFYYLESMALESTVLTLNVYSEPLDKDFKMLRNLSSIAQYEYNIPERRNQAFEYIRQILNDLDVVVNENTGEYFGVTYSGGGNTQTIEDFIGSGE